MNEHKEHINQFSAAAIQQYLDGQLTPAEMHAMEKAALEDPFLADALEGIALQQAASVRADMQDLQHRLQERAGKEDGKKGAPVIAFRFWQAAAAALLLITGTVWVYNSLDSNKAESRLANNDVAAQTQADSTENTNTVAGNDSATDNAVAGNSTTAAEKIEEVEAESKELSMSKASKAPAPVNNRSSATIKTDSTVYFSAITDEKSKAGKPVTTPPVSNARKLEEIVIRGGKGTDSIEHKASDDLVNTKDNPLQGVVKDDSQPKLKSFISGLVMNEKDVPLPNAFVQVEKYKKNFVTDKYGLFKIPATDSDSVVDISVSVRGYSDQKFRLKNSSNLTVNQLRLQPDNAAASNSFIDVKDKARLQKKQGSQTRYPTVMVQDALPAYGWLAYEKYIGENKKPPADNPHVKGDVVVSFQVNRKGNLSDFKVEQSLAKGYDEEAIRLIKEGPEWKLQKGRKARVTILVRF